MKRHHHPTTNRAGLALIAVLLATGCAGPPTGATPTITPAAGTVVPPAAPPTVGVRTPAPASALLADAPLLDLHQTGQVEFAPDRSAVARLAPGAALVVEQRGPMVVQRLEVTPDATGAPRYAYSVDGRPQPFDQTARDWLARVLAQLLARRDRLPTPSPERQPAPAQPPETQ